MVMRELTTVRGLTRRIILGLATIAASAATASADDGMVNNRTAEASKSGSALQNEITSIVAAPSRQVLSCWGLAATNAPVVTVHFELNRNGSLDQRAAGRRKHAHAQRCGRAWRVEPIEQQKAREVRREHPPTLLPSFSKERTQADAR
jgi:hypothetical protein